MLEKVRWPPSPLGLGTPLNLGFVSREPRRRLKASWWLIPSLGVLTPAVMLGIDELLFEGVSLRRVEELGSEPLPFRLLVVVYSGVTEELVYRLFAATSIAWLVHGLLSRVVDNAKTLSQWIGAILAAVLFGLAHVANLADVPHPVLRAVTINGVAGIVLGWLYWWRGLEAAILTHMVAIAVLYIAVPLFL